MTKDINTLTDAELSARLGEVLGEKCWHVFTMAPHDKDKHCLKCSQMKIGATEYETIPLDDWNVAMKWRDWAVAEYGEDDEGDTYFVKAMMGIYNLCGEKYGITAWLTDKARPRDYLIAAAKCLENE